METIDYGDTDYRYEMEGDTRGVNDPERGALGELGYQTQEFDEDGELVSAEEDDFAEDDMAMDLDFED